MTRLFLRFYLGILLSFLITMIAVVGWLLRETPEDRAVVEDSLRGGVALAHERLSTLRGGDRGAELAALSRRFGYPVEIRTLARISISSEAEARLLTGNTVLAGEHVYRLIRGDDVLMMGPLPAFQFGSGGGWVIAFVVLVWAAASFLLLRPVFRSTRHLEATASKMAGGDLSARIEPGRVAFSRLAESFNSMAETTEKLVSDQRELLAAVSHEFRTPLARLRFASEMAGAAQDDAKRASLLAEMDADVVELEALVAELLDAMRVEHAGSSSTHDEFQLDQVVSDLLSSFASEPVEVRWTDEADRVGALFERRPFERALRNLVANACRYARTSVEIKTMERDETLWVSVSDDGPGIAEGERQRVLQPFVQLGEPAPEHSGSGLGLAIVARIVRNRGGDIDIDAAPSGGARVSFSWPLGPRSVARLAE